MREGLCKAIEEKRSIGLALGGGAARGCAHIGVIRALEENKIPISCIAGTSIGSLVGSVYASGGLDELESLLVGMDMVGLMKFFDVAFPHSGLVNGKSVSRLLEKLIGGRSFEGMKIPFCAVATDIITGGEVSMSSGDVVEAVRASIAVPGVFTPVLSGEKVLVDGGLVNPVPVNAARDLGADYVLAVDLNRYVVETKNEARNDTHIKKFRRRLEEGSLASSLMEEFDRFIGERKTKARSPNIVDVIVTSINIMESSITKNRLKTDVPDILLSPKLGHILFMEFFRAQEAIDAGYEAAMELFKD